MTQALQILEQNTQRFLTTAQPAEAYGTDERRIIEQANCTCGRRKAHCCMPSPSTQTEPGKSTSS